MRFAHWALRAHLDAQRLRSLERRQERLQKFSAINQNNTKLSTAVRFPVVLADPPYFFETYTSADANERAPDYPTMKLEDICALPVRELATDTAVLFLWSPSTFLEVALQVVAAWGFTYSTSAVWEKTDCAPGNGWFVRQQHETLLIARRGDFPPPPPSTRPASIIKAPRRGHSVKPDLIYTIIERMYPDLLKIELFARQTRPGWVAWGNQIPPGETGGAEIPAHPEADEGVEYDDGDGLPLHLPMGPGRPQGPSLSGAGAGETRQCLRVASDGRVLLSAS